MDYRLTSLLTSHVPQVSNILSVLEEFPFAVAPTRILIGSLAAFLLHIVPWRAHVANAGLAKHMRCERGVIVQERGRCFPGVIQIHIC